MRAELTINFGVVEVTADEADAVGEQAPGLLVERDRHAAHLPSRHEAANLLAEVIAEFLVGLLAASQAHDGEVAGNQAAADEVVYGRHDQPFGQIAAGTENYPRARRTRSPMTRTP